MADEAKNNRILTPREAYARVGISRVTAWKLWKVGKFPRPIQITEGRNGFIEREIDAWIDAKIAARDARGTA
jgi:prophage regulatory protein